MRGADRDRFVRPVGRAGDEDGAISVGHRVFWVVDNGSSHRGQAAINRLRKAYRKAVLVHTPVHASWLNQVEIYFSIIQRKVLTPNDFASLEEVEQRLRLYEELTNREPRAVRLEIQPSRSANVYDQAGGQASAPVLGFDQLIGQIDCRAWAQPYSQL